MMAIGEVARQSGVPIDAIRFYEREGIVPKRKNGTEDTCAYSLEDVRRLRFLKKCLDLGFLLSDAEVLLDFSENLNSDCGSVQKIAEAHLTTVREKLSELRKLESALGKLTSKCSNGLVECPMLDALKSD